jgi:hypothetical protein
MTPAGLYLIELNIYSSFMPEMRCKAPTADTLPEAAPTTGSCPVFFSHLL